jgi:hypothetical protein
MTTEQFDREKRYSSLMYIAERMLKTDIITQEELDNLDGYFHEKYHPIRVYSLDFPAGYLVESILQGRDDNADADNTQTRTPTAGTAAIETSRGVLPSIVRQGRHAAFTVSANQLFQ